jgi:outer membrane protein assembly factor BamB
MRFLFSETTKNILLTLLAISLSAGKQSCAQTFSLARPFILKWNYRSEILTTLSPVYDGESVYLPLSDGTLISLRMRDGQLLWKADIGGDFSTSPTVVGQVVYAITRTKRFDEADHLDDLPVILRAISRTSGVTLWTRRLAHSSRVKIIFNDHSSFATVVDDRIYAFDQETGEEKWTVQLPSHFFTQIKAFGTNLYLSTRDGYLFALDQETGRTLWRYRTRDEVAALVASRDGILYLGTAGGYVCALREAGGKLSALWRKHAGTRVQTISYAGDGLLVTTQDNFALFFEPRNGRRLWKRLMPARLSEQPLVDSDSALFAPLGEESCVVLSLRDGRQVNTISLGKDNSILGSPTSSGEFLFIPTRSGLMAFAPAK